MRATVRTAWLGITAAVGYLRNVAASVAGDLKMIVGAITGVVVVAVRIVRLNIVAAAVYLLNAAETVGNAVAQTLRQLRKWSFSVVRAAVLGLRSTLLETPFTMLMTGSTECCKWSWICA